MNRINWNNPPVRIKFHTVVHVLQVQVQVDAPGSHRFTTPVVNPLRFSKLSGSYDHTARGQLFSFTQYISLHRIINNEH